MSEAQPDELMARLPRTLAIFPLEGALLLPHGQMPLHIFEPRYRNMIEEALGNERMLGMVQPRGSHPHPVPDDAELFGSRLRRPHHLVYRDGGRPLRDHTAGCMPLQDQRGTAAT